MTIVEKILAQASGATKVSPGDLAVVDVDTVVLVDLNFKPTARELVKIFDPDKIVVIFDHAVPAPDAISAMAQTIGRDFVRRFGIRRFHDCGSDQGISHVIVADKAYALPGTVLVSGDSHTCASGALNCAARGVGRRTCSMLQPPGRPGFRWAKPSATT